jgi:FdhE protein
VKSPYQRRLDRARTLINQDSPTSELLSFYIELAKLQSAIFEQADSSDLAPLLRWFPDLTRLVDRNAPQLAGTIQSESELLELLRACWEGGADEIDPRRVFFATALLQPFAAKLATRGLIDANWTGARCPFCGSRAALAVLRGEGDGAKRSLLCSLCSTEWNFRRILCPNCGEEDKAKLPVYTPAGAEHVRVEACDTCRSYLKSIDLTRNGIADPVVDEIASLPLNIWAERQGYTKIAPNVLGM